MWLKRSIVIDSEEIALRKNYKMMSDAKLREIHSHRVPYCQQRAVLEQILYERDFRKKFLTSGLPGWIGLGISLFLLILHLLGR